MSLRALKRSIQRREAFLGRRYAYTNKTRTLKLERPDEKLRPLMDRDYINPIQCVRTR